MRATPSTIEVWWISTRAATGELAASSASATLPWLLMDR